MATLGTSPAARVRETTTDTGTGNFVLDGAKNDKDQPFLGTYAGGTTNVPYLIANQDAAEWEEGLATVQDDGSGNSEIVRGGSQTVTASSNSGSAVNFGSGTKDVFSPLSAEQSQAIFDHVNSTSNPHSVTKSQVSLGNVPNEDATDPTNWDYGLTGIDTTVVTGTAGTGGNLAEWNADGDLVGSGTATSSVFTTSSDVDHDSTTNFVSNEHIDHSGVSISAGTAMTGGGDITSSRTLNVDVGTSSSQVPQNSDLGTQAYNDQHIAGSSQNTNNGDITYVV